MKEVIVAISSALLFVYFVVSSMFLFAGVEESGRKRCDPPFSRIITYVVPAYKLGCYLGQPAED